MPDQQAISTEGGLPDFCYVQQLVADAMARTNPDAPAIRAFGQQVTYRQLDEQSGKLSQAILRVAPDAERIGISCTRTVDMVIGVLAILKAGKAYLPLDPAYPEARLQQLITDSQVRVCLATAVDDVLFTTLGLQVLRSDEPQAGPVRPVTQQSETACVLYTSGSTGKPKGVCLTHRGLVNMLTNQVRRWADQPGLQTLQFCHLSFDASFQEIFVPLLTGGTVHLIDDAYRLNAGRLLDYIEQEHISRVFLPYVVLQYLTEAAVADSRFPTRLQEIITGGELLKITPAIARFFEALPDCTLMNVYGPTEASVWVTENRLRGNAQSWPQLPSIGRVVAGCEVVIVDEQLTVVPDGKVGEIGICGVCLADGYLNQPERTADAFVDWQHPRLGPTKLYRTGDLARLLPDGTFDFHGRRDTQVKIRGNRVELGEIEVLLAQQPAIQQAVVVAREDIPGHKRLVAYVVASPADFSVPALRAVLAERLPDFMLPTYYVRLDDLPRTTSGKVDKAQLPPPDHGRPDLTTLYRPARTALEKQIVGLWEEWLQLDPVGCDDNFFELGGNSLLAQQTVAALEQRGFTVPITKLYQHPTAAGLAAFIQPAVNARTQQTTPEPTSRRPATADDAIAVIGMSGRFPGASTIDELWTVLKEGRETTRFFTEAELDASIPATLRNDPGYVKARGVIDGADQFDARFFGLTPAIAQVMDPQQRIFLEIAYEALESTGHLPELYGGRVGVFAGCGNNTYYLNNVLTNSAVVAQVGSFQAMTVNEKDYIASRTAYQLNLNGPAVSVYSACSTSLLAIAQAVQSLRSGQCEVALAGGASITAPVNSGHLYQEGAMFSRDGHTRSFNADSTGTVFSDGAGVVLLKRLDDAQRDGDTIYAAIKGVGVNNDGGNKGSFTAPNADGQAGSIRMALADAQVDPATIRYVEAHGTATPVGDPIEIEGLTEAFGPQTRQQYCAIGSIKSNMGHLTQAAGVAGVIKTVLSLYHRQIPASINFEKPNPTIDFANSPFYVNTTLRDWVQDESELPRRAGVSSFGVGGTNVHVVLEEAAVGPHEATADAPATATPARPVQLLTWSAKSVQSRDTYGAQLADQLRQANAPALADAAFTLQTTRPNYSHRRFAVATTPDDFSGAVSSAANARTLSRVPGDVVFLFPGQGAQFLNMGRALYEHEPTFRQAVDECAGHLQPHLGADIRHVLYPDTVSSEAEQQLRNTLYTQAALFVTEYALARLWMSWGIEPSILCGHSVGEFVAAHLAGVFTLPDVLRLVAARGRLVSEQPRGSMLSVRVGIETLQSLVPDTLSVAAINSRHLCVVAGLDEDIADFARLLDEQEIPNRPLATSHAFHSAMMDPVVTRFADIVKTIPLSRPQRPVVSTVTGTFLSDAQATDPGYWATHLRATVRFADALDTLFGLDEPLLLEVGPGRTVATLARQQATDQPMTALAGLATQADAKTTYESILTTLGQLYLHGLPINWQAFYATQKTHRVSLPTYAFDRRRCWVDAPLPATVTTSTNDRSISTQPTDIPIATPPMRTTALIDKIYQLLEDASGIEMAGTSPDTNFLELGFDSLLLTQMAITLRNEFGTPITFRQLTADLDSPKALATFLDQQLPAEQYQPTPAAAPVAQPISQPVPVAATPVAAPVATPVMPPPVPVPMMAAPAMVPVAMPGGDSALGLIAQQLQLLARQVALMQGVAPQPVAVQPVPVPPVVQPAPTTPAPQPAPVAAATVAAAPAKPVTVSMPTGGTSDLTPEEQIEHKKPFGATAKIEKHSHELTTVQRQFLDRLTKQYNQKTAGSKAYAQQHRSQMADPRVVSGFRPVTKEIVYPIVVNRSAGSRLWDVDGNEYIDVLNGFGSNMFGYQPDFIKQALHEQIEKGFEVGPQHELAGEVTELVCELTGSERVALCNTGSEAVLGAMRVARTITGRSLIVAFAGSYHGIVDEVLVRGSKKLKTFPAASGIMANVVQNMLILDYGTDESLRIIRERADELAAVLVEPIQSRRPEFVPIEFLKELRSITAASGSALIFDEVITGFRMHLGGAQALLGIRADMATYGKVAGAGMSIGIIGGKRSFMDALDGGFWQYGDASAPEVGVTYFAGTFVRHPLALAAAKASMLHLREQGTGLQQALTRKTTYLADTLNAYLTERQLPMFIAHFGSLWKLKYTDDLPYSELLFTLLRQKGIHVWDGFPCFMTEAHTDEEINTVITAFCQSVDEMVEATFFPGKASTGKPAVHEGLITYPSEPPVAGARLGRDPAGNPAWFLPDPNRPGAYLQVDLTI